MAEIINIDDLIPPDIELQYRGASYTIPGDLDTETVLRVFETFRQVLALSSAGAGEVKTADIKKASETLRDLLLGVFQIRNPELTSLPFGSTSTPIVVQHLLRSLGVDLFGENEETTPTQREASPSREKSSPSSAKAPAKPRSRSSRG